jgi:hypothetical protein
MGSFSRCGNGWAIHVFVRRKEPLQFFFCDKDANRSMIVERR